MSYAAGSERVPFFAVWAAAATVLLLALLFVFAIREDKLRERLIDEAISCIDDEAGRPVARNHSIECTERGEHGYARGKRELHP